MPTYNLSRHRCPACAEVRLRRDEVLLVIGVRGGLVNEDVQLAKSGEHGGLAADDTQLA